MNPRYVAYARAHGRTPEAMRTHDRTRWPGGIMAGYIVWIGEQWRRWHAANPGALPDHESFDAMLCVEADEARSA